MFDWKSAKKPIVALSPMADMTDSAFCRVVKEVAAEAGVKPPLNPSLAGGGAAIDRARE